MRPAARGVLPGEPGMLAVPKGHCRGCGKPVPPGRRSWCSEECIERMKVANWPGHARMRVFERDKGVCSSCGADCDAIERRVQAFVAMKQGEQSHVWWLRKGRLEKWFRRLGLGGNVYKSLWEMDHRTPVVEGGGGCTLENLRTLCRPCHKRETRALAARRAEARRRATPQMALSLNAGAERREGE